MPIQYERSEASDAYINNVWHSWGAGNDKIAI